MDAKELMIGDWVSHNGIRNRIAPADLIPDVHKKWLEEAQPIPITHEILEKNGFYVKREFNGGVIEETCSLDKTSWVSFTMYGFRAGWLCEWARIGCRLHIYNIDKNNEFCGTVKYVHELQHALRLCGIEKDIEL